MTARRELCKPFANLQLLRFSVAPYLRVLLVCRLTQPERIYKHHTVSCQGNLAGNFFLFSGIRSRSRKKKSAKHFRAPRFSFYFAIRRAFATAYLTAALFAPAAAFVVAGAGLPHAHLSHLQSAFLASAVQPQASHLQAAFFAHCAGHWANAVETVIAIISAIAVRNIFILVTLSSKRLRGPNNLKQRN